jgi:ribosomal protein S18 acetylase RimI-like enzyme
LKKFVGNGLGYKEFAEAGRSDDRGLSKAYFDENGRLIGYAAVGQKKLGLEESALKSNGISADVKVHIHDIVAGPAAEGIGKKIMNALARDVRQKGAAGEIYLTVESRNESAIQEYETWGFERIGNFIEKTDQKNQVGRHYITYRVKVGTLLQNTNPDNGAPLSQPSQTTGARLAATILPRIAVGIAGAGPGEVKRILEARPDLSARAAFYELDKDKTGLNPGAPAQSYFEYLKKVQTSPTDAQTLLMVSSREELTVDTVEEALRDAEEKLYYTRLLQSIASFEEEELTQVLRDLNLEEISSAEVASAIDQIFADGTSVSLDGASIGPEDSRARVYQQAQSQTGI